VAERDYINPQQKDRFESDPWEKTISEYISPLSRVEVSEIAREALKIESVGRIGTADQRRITAVLAANGWHPGRTIEEDSTPELMTHDPP
jgi:hypothetical protein